MKPQSPITKREALEEAINALITLRTLLRKSAPGNIIMVAEDGIPPLIQKIQRDRMNDFRMIVKEHDPILERAIINWLNYALREPARRELLGEMPQDHTLDALQKLFFDDDPEIERAVANWLSPSLREPARSEALSVNAFRPSKTWDEALKKFCDELTEDLREDTLRPSH